MRSADIMSAIVMNRSASPLFFTALSVNHFSSARALCSLRWRKVVIRPAPYTHVFKTELRRLAPLLRRTVALLSVKQARDAKVENVEFWRKG